jgi:SAM-dependent methyltransferase
MQPHHPPGPDPLAVLLHRGGPAGQWGNLGLWPPAPTDGAKSMDQADYAGACRALALAVGQTAGLQRGDHVLSLACGAGEELRLWTGEFGAARVLGIERDPTAAARAQALCAGDARIHVACRPALPLDSLAADGARFDAIVCVDAAYHLSPRGALLAGAARLLRPGGRLALADLTLQDRPSPLLRGAARLCGVPAADLLPLPAQVQRLQALGFADVQARALDDAVLGGFARFVRRQARAHRLRAWQPGWRGAAITAALIPPCRAAGLGYALLAATWPGSAPSRAPSRSATA